MAHIGFRGGFLKQGIGAPCILVVPVGYELRTGASSSHWTGPVALNKAIDVFCFRV